MRRIRLIIGMLAVMAVMMVGAAPAMADDDECYWSWDSYYGWYVACDDDDWYDDDWNDDWYDDDWDDD